MGKGVGTMDADRNTPEVDKAAEAKAVAAEAVVGVVVGIVRTTITTTIVKPKKLTPRPTIRNLRILPQGKQRR